MSSITERNNLDTSKTAFLLCDLQEKFQAAIFKFNEIVEIASRLVLFIITYFLFLILL